MTTPTQELREQVARIVDPEAWDEISAEDNQDGADIFADAWELALAKADAILALPPPSPVKEAVERLTDDLSRAREDGLVLTDAPNLRALLAENARLVKLVEEAGEAAMDAQSTLSAWFEIATKAEDEIAPVLLSGLKGYLRTSKNGGMPTKDADTAYAVLEDYIRLYAGRDLTPIVRHVASLTHKTIKDAQ